MGLKDMFQNVVKGANDYLTNGNLKEKMMEIKDKTVAKVKGIDNPELYSAPEGFTVFTVPVAVSMLDANEAAKEKLKSIYSNVGEKVADSYIRLLILLSEGEKVIYEMSATMKKSYIVAWTNKDRIIIVHKENYKIFTREEIHTFRIKETGVSGLTFILNEYELVGTDKSKTYHFIRNYCHETTPNYMYIPYVPVTKNLNYYENFKYNKLAHENDAVDENKQLSVAFAVNEYPIVSIFANNFGHTYVLALTTNHKLYIINEKEYTILDMSEVKQIGLMNKGVFSAEFYMDNYYFTGSGQEDNVLRFIEYMHNSNAYEEAKNNLLEDNRVLMTFPFENAISYQTLGGEGLVVSADKEKFLICLKGKKMEMYEKEDFGHYELILEEGINKENVWNTNNNGEIPKVKITKEMAIPRYENASALIFLKNKQVEALKIPFILMKTIIYAEEEITLKPSEDSTKKMIEVLDFLVTNNIESK